jgi:GxxExxY protein
LDYGDCIQETQGLTTDCTDDTDMGKLIHETISEQILGAAMAVLSELKPGLDEKLYENALVIELRERGHSVNQQKMFKVEYKGREIGRLIPDLIVDDLVIADPKVVSVFNETHLAQMTGYLALTELRLALLLNFKYAKLQWKRVVR